MKIEIHSEFKGGKTILIKVSSDDLRRLHGDLLRLSQTTGAKLRLSTAEVEISAESSTLSMGLIAAKHERLAAFQWTLSQKDWKAHADKLAGLLNSKLPGHQYLEIPGNPWTVVVSKGEYPVESR